MKKHRVFIEVPDVQMMFMNQEKINYKWHELFRQVDKNLNFSTINNEYDNKLHIFWSILNGCAYMFACVGAWDEGSYRSYM